MKRLFIFFLFGLFLIPSYSQEHFTYDDGAVNLTEDGESSSDILKMFANPDDSTYLKVTMDNVAGNVVVLCMVVSGLFFLIRFLHGMWTQIIVKKGQAFFDLKSVLTGVILLVLLSVYVPAFKFVGNSIDLVLESFIDQRIDVNKSLAKRMFLKNLALTKDDIGFSKEVYENLAKNASSDPATNMKNLEKALMDLEEEESSFWNTVSLQRYTKFFDKLLHTLKKAPVQIINKGLLLFSMAVRFCAVIMIYGMDAFLYCVGPLAIVVSLIPAYKEKFQLWFTTWVTIKCCMITFVVMDMVYFAFESSDALAGYYSSFTSYDNNSILALGMGVSYSVAHIMVFWMTTRWIGNSDAGEVISYGMLMMVQKGADFGSGVINKLNKLGDNSPGGGGNESGLSGSLTSTAKNKIDNN